MVHGPGILPSARTSEDSALRKTALIVDDSKSARVVLKRLLESHDLDVDTAESAEAALEYLIDHRPDVVFMDHMMPGMDGFEAVTAIKSNPDTATIPIMMYTSQEGEVYVGQARALGAVGVLPKKMEPVEVSKVLRSLRVIGDEAERRKSAGKLQAEGANDEYPGIDKLDKELRILIQDLFDQQRAILRRDLLDSYETIAARVAEEIRAPVVAAEEFPKSTRLRVPTYPRDSKSPSHCCPYWSSLSPGYTGCVYRAGRRFNRRTPCCEMKSNTEVQTSPRTRLQFRIESMNSRSPWERHIRSLFHRLNGAPTRQRATNLMSCHSVIGGGDYFQKCLIACWKSASPAWCGSSRTLAISA